MNTDKPEMNTYLSRREVLAALGGVGLLAALVSGVRGSLRFLTPPVNQSNPTIIVAGPPANFPLDQLTPLTDGLVFIGRDNRGFFALSVVCTHLGCPVTRGGQGLTCPCHSSRFAGDGANLSGPASQPLAHLALSLNDEGDIEVNVAQNVPPDTRLVWTS